MFTRRWQRLIRKQMLLGTCVLVVIFILSIFHSNRPTLYHTPQDSDSDDAFYRAFDSPDNSDGLRAILGGAGGKPVFQSGRRRTLNTSEGVVYVKDILFKPKKPLSKGANVYQLDKLNSSQFLGNHQSVEDQMELLSNNRPKSQEELSNLLNQLQFARGGKENERKPRAAPFLPDKRREGGQGFEVLNSMCSRPPCKEFLTPLDTPHFKYCRKKAKIKSEHEPSATACHFRKATPDTPLTALASPLGSGAGTLRWLLQELTGLCTGSIYCNVNLRRAGYAGECVRSSTVLVVASDQTDPFWSGTVPNSLNIPNGFSKIIDVPVFDKAVYLLRNPYDVIMEAWSQLRAVKDQDQELSWDKFVVDHAALWHQTAMSWLLHNQNHPILLVSYEGLMNHTSREFLRILNFLEVSYSTEKLAEVGWSGVKKNSVPGTYNVNQVDYINSMISKMAVGLSSSTLAQDVDVFQYLYRYS